MRFVLAFFALAVLAGCGSTSPSCDSSSCPTGCCDPSGACQSASALSCGANGAACSACSLGQQCVLGQCAGTNGGGGSGATGGGSASTGGGSGSTGGGSASTGGGTGSTGGGSASTGGGNGSTGGGSASTGGGNGTTGGGSGAMGGGSGSTGGGGGTTPTCPNCGLGTVCHPVLNTCVSACTSASDCPAAQKTCTHFDGSAPTSNSPGFCQCATDGLCAAAISGQICQGATKQCSAKCTSAGCPAGLTCQSSSGQCTQGGAGTPPVIALTFPATCPTFTACGGLTTGTFAYASACVDDAEFAPFVAQATSLCGAGSTTLRNKGGTISGTVSLSPGSITRAVTGTLTVTADIGGTCANASLCSQAPSIAASVGFSATCAFANNLCTCQMTRPLTQQGTESYSASPTQLTMSPSNRTYDFCVVTNGFNYHDVSTSLSTRDPGFYGMTVFAP